MLNVALVNFSFILNMFVLEKKEKNSFLANNGKGKWTLCRWKFIKLLKFIWLLLWLLYAREAGNNEPFRVALSTVDNTDALHLGDQHW